jgi:hypothetical protein
MADVDKMSYKHQTSDACNPRLSRLPSGGVLCEMMYVPMKHRHFMVEIFFGLEKKMAAVRAGSYSHRLEGSVCPHTHPTLLLRPSCLPEKMGMNKKRRKLEVVYP